MVKHIAAAIIGSLSFGLLAVIGYNVLCTLTKVPAETNTNWTIFWICAAVGMVIAFFDGDWGD